MIKNSVIGCDSLTGGLDSLEEVNHLDIFGDGANIPVKAGDICYVILDGGPSYCYVARDDLSPVTDGYRTVAMQSGGLIVWECRYIADLEQAPEVPLIVQESTGLVPTGFSSVASGYARDTVFKSGDTPFRDYPLLALYRGYLYIITGTSSYEDVYQLELSTGNSVQNMSVVVPVYYPAGCMVDEGSFMVYDTYSNKSARVNLVSTLNNDYATPIPGASRSRACAAGHGGKGYIFGGTNSFLEVYEHDRSLDSYTTSNPAAYVRKADLPREVIDGGAVTVGDKIYIFHRSGDIRGLIYDPVLDLWDDTTIPDYATTADDHIKYNIFYDSELQLICISLGNPTFPGMQQIVIGYDTVLNTWSEVRRQPFDLESEDTSCIYDTDTDTTIHTMDSPPYVVRLHKDIRNLCIQDTI